MPFDEPAHSLKGGSREALLQQLILASDRLPTAGGLRHASGLAVEQASSQDMGKVVHALRKRPAASRAKGLTPGVFTPRLAALLTPPLVEPGDSVARRARTDGTASLAAVQANPPTLRPSASAASAISLNNGGAGTRHPLQMSCGKSKLREGEPRGGKPMASRASAATSQSITNLVPDGASVVEVQAAQEHVEELASSMAEARPHASSLALRFHEGSVSVAAIASFLAIHPLFKLLSPHQLKRLAAGATFVSGARYTSIYREGSHVDRPGSLGGGVGIILEGIALLRSTAALALPRRLGLAEWVGGGSLICSQVPRLHTCEWVSNGLALMLSLQALRAAAQVCYSLALLIVVCYSKLP